MRKGPVKFLLDRLKRLGIPLIVYSLLLTPAIITVLHWGEGVGFMYYVTHRENWIQVGVLWFTSALLLFSCIYLVLYTTGTVKPRRMTLPGDGAIALLGLCMGVISFLVRIVFPIGITLTPFGFQPAHFTQYIILFTLGFVAYRNGWIGAIGYERGRKWLRISMALVFLGMPCLYVLKFVTHVETDAFLGGLTLHSFANAIWEQVLGVSMVMALLGVGKVWWTSQGGLLKEMSRGAYVVYIIHPLVLVTVSIVLKDFQLPSLVKFVLAGAGATLISFVMGAVLVRLPFVKNVV